MISLIKCGNFEPKCTKMRLAAGLRPDPLGSLSAPPDPLAVNRGRGRVRKGEGGKGKRGKGKGREGKEKEGKGEGRGRGGKGKGCPPQRRK